MAPKPMNENDNDLDSAVSENNHAKETERDSGKVGSGEGALAEVVAELRTEVRALKSELRGVQVGLSECAAARADARRTENDHVRVQWLQREMAETREVCCILIMAHWLINRFETNASTASADNSVFWASFCHFHSRSPSDPRWQS